MYLIICVLNNYTNDSTVIAQAPNNSFHCLSFQFTYISCHDNILCIGISW